MKVVLELGAPHGTLFADGTERALLRVPVRDGRGRRVGTIVATRITTDRRSIEATARLNRNARGIKATHLRIGADVDLDAE